MNEQLQQFIEENIQLIDKNKFQDLYTEAELAWVHIPELTCLLYDADIDPLPHMTVVPEDFIVNVGSLISCSREVSKVFKSFRVPEGIQIIDESAFQNCRILQEIHLPSTLVRIEDFAFNQCESLQTMYINMTNKQWQTNVKKGIEWRRQTPCLTKFVFTDTTIEF